MYIPQTGYVGVGIVEQSAQPVTDFLVTTPKGEEPILEVDDLVAQHMGANADDSDRREYLVRVRWLKTHDKAAAFWEQGLFANQNTATKLRDAHTIERLERHFGI